MIRGAGAWLSLLVLVVALEGGMGRAEAAESPIFYWVDARGDLHATDRLADVPEPYHAMYLAKLRALEEAREGGPPTPPPPPPKPAPSASSPAGPQAPAPSVVDTLGARRQYWKALVAQWRQELERATAALREASNALAQAELNPVLRQTPEQRAVIDQAKAKQDAALKQVEKAKKMLLEDIPKRARAEEVPPKWLE